jgi:hypothetical protein
MSPALAALVALQALDSAAEAARRTIAEMPAALAASAGRAAEAAAAVAAAKARQEENHQRRRGLEKDVAGVESRMARFEDHKAAVKTNQEYTALLHEIATAKAERDTIEERLLIAMEEADTLLADVKAAEAAAQQAASDADALRAALDADKRTLDEELARLAVSRRGEAGALPSALLQKYETLLKQRRGLAIAPMTGEICSACQMRQRPHVVQQIRRNDEPLQCESCQRLLYAPPAAP